MSERRTEAICFLGKGGSEVIALGETSVRSPGHGEVVVEVVAAGLNRADLLQRRGLYPAPPGAPADVPGLELSGRVVERGPAASAFAVGAPVMAIVGGGAMARQVTLHERELLLVPEGLELVTAAGIPEVFLTAWDALLAAGLTAGETVLVHAAGSGVGTAATQLVRAFGGRPLATTRSARKLERILEHGVAAGDALVVSDGRFATGVLERTSGGADVILDCVGGAYLEENLRALAPRGRMVMIGTLGGGAAPLPIGIFLSKRAKLVGSVMRSRPLEEKMALAQRANRELVPMFRSPARLVPVIDRVMKMSECAAAHEALEANETVGKIVLAW
jgi:putative PIG3 family NAD(P)H quinone oxidoreductase